MSAVTSGDAAGPAGPPPELARLSRTERRALRMLLAEHGTSLVALVKARQALERWAGSGVDAPRLAALVSAPLPAAIQGALATDQERRAAREVCAARLRHHQEAAAQLAAELERLEPCLRGAEAEAQTRPGALQALQPRARQVLVARWELQTAGTPRRTGLGGIWAAVSGQAAARQRHLEGLQRALDGLWADYRRAAQQAGLTDVPAPDALDDAINRETARCREALQTLRKEQRRLLGARDELRQPIAWLQGELQRQQRELEVGWANLRQFQGLPADRAEWERVWNDRLTGQQVLEEWQQIHENVQAQEQALGEYWGAWPTHQRTLPALRDALERQEAREAAEREEAERRPPPVPAAPATPGALLPAVSAAPLETPLPLPRPPLPGAGRAAPLPAGARTGPPTPALPTPRPERRPSARPTVTPLFPPLPGTGRPAAALPRPAPAVSTPPRPQRAPPTPPQASPQPPLLLPVAPPAEPPARPAPPVVPPLHAPTALDSAVRAQAAPLPAPLPPAPARPMPPASPPLPAPAARSTLQPSPVPAPPLPAVYRLRAPALPLPGAGPRPAPPPPAPAHPERLTRRQRAEREAVRIADQYSWARGFAQLADSLDRGNWGQLRTRIEAEIARGMTPEEFELVLQMRAYWHEQTHFQSPYTARYDSMPWSLALSLIRRSAGVPCIEEMTSLIERLYDHAAQSPFRRMPAFAQRLGALLETADPDLDIEFWLGVQEARCSSR